MKLTVLVDNNTYIDRYYLGEPGVCYYIEDNDDRILFDAGYSDVFIRNAAAMSIDLSGLTAMVISHGHNDHTRGLQYLFQQTDLSNAALVAHPQAFKEKQFEGDSIGSPLSEEYLRERCRLTLSDKPLNVGDNLIFLGEIPQIHAFENRQPFGSTLDNGRRCDDLVKDDSALVYRSERGLFIVTGCSHSGICNIIEYAKRVCGDERVIGVIGGFHLFEPSLQLTKTVRYFQANRINQLYPCHCVSFAAKAEINKAIPIGEVGVGMQIEIV